MVLAISYAHTHRSIKQIFIDRPDEVGRRGG